MSRQVSRGLAGDYEADEQAGVSRLSWRLSWVTAYLQLLQPNLIGRHVIFNTDKMEVQARALVAFEGRKTGSVAHM